LTEITGLKTYRTGSPDAKAAIILIYDVFGITPQIKQGADLLAAGDKFQVFIPDFLKGQYVKTAWFGPNVTPEHNAEKAAYFGPGGIGSPPGVGDLLVKVAEELKSSFGITKLGVVGYCWGSKVIALKTKEGTPFAAAAHVHPSMMSVEDDAPNIVVPTAILASKDEDPATIKAYVEALKVPKFSETYADAPHGWMTTRADLSQEKARKDFHTGYQTVSNWFSDHIL